MYCLCCILQCISCIPLPAPVLGHEEGGDDGGRPGAAVVAVDQHTTRGLALGQWATVNIEKTDYFTLAKFSQKSKK